MTDMIHGIEDLLQGILTPCTVSDHPHQETHINSEDMFIIGKYMKVII